MTADLANPTVLFRAMIGEPVFVGGERFHTRDVSVFVGDERCPGVQACTVVEDRGRLTGWLVVRAAGRVYECSAPLLWLGTAGGEACDDAPFEVRAVDHTSGVARWQLVLPGCRWLPATHLADALKGWKLIVAVFVATKEQP